MQEISVLVGEKELTFGVTTAGFNEYINAQMPKDKVTPGFNFLSLAVLPEHKEDFMALAIKDGEPNGLIVLQIAGIVSEAFGGDVTVTIKKPNPSAQASKKTASTS